MNNAIFGILQKAKAAVRKVRYGCILLVKKYNKQVRRYHQWQQNPHHYAHAEYADDVECKNCRRAYRGAYCPECGQAAATPRITFRSMILRTLDVWGFGNRSMPRTLAHLLLRPGYMITDYIEGRRQPYFPPIKMLFVLGAIYLLLMAAINVGAKIMHSEKSVSDFVLDYVGLAPTEKATESVDTLQAAGAEEVSIEGGDTIVDFFGQILRDDTIVATTDNPGKTKTVHIDRQSGMVKAMQGMGKEKFSAALDALMSKTLVMRLFVLSLLYAMMTKAFFNRSPRCQNYNFTEMFFAQILIFNQVLLVAIVLACFGVMGDLSSFTIIPWWLHVLILTIDYKQMFGVSTRSAIIRTVTLTLVVDLLIVLILIIVLVLMVLSVVQVS
ncbi:MAG: DUF3667 domain-containing protein [Muribaculaceae bacterium]